MKFITWLFVLTAISVCLCGCGQRPATSSTTLDAAKVKRTAKQAGYMAVMGWIIAAKPADEVVASVEPVMETLVEAVNGIPDKGFVSLLEDAKVLVYSRIPETKKAERLAACKLVEIVLTELDKLLEAHPEWKTNQDLVVNSLGKFLNGALQAMKDYLED